MRRFLFSLVAFLSLAMSHAGIVYFDNSGSNWGAVYVWGWDTGLEGSWSAALTIDSATGLYKYETSTPTDNILFANINNWSAFPRPSQTGNYKYIEGAVYTSTKGPAYKNLDAWIEANHGGGGGDDYPVISDVMPSGTLPVLHINIYKGSQLSDISADGANLNEGITFNNEVLDKDLGDKNYRPGAYWITVPEGEQYAKYREFALGSEEQPLLLEMKARGNFTRQGFSKKPFKLKLSKKQNLCGLTPDKNKHYAILTHADDTDGYLRNFTGFNLGKKMGLPWTPGMQPVEVVINGDYRGVYFLTESIRVSKGRIDITEGADNETLADNLSGGYLVELDNYYDEPGQIYITPGNYGTPGHDRVWITPDTPEEYSDLQRRFVTEQFTEMHNDIKRRDDNLWRYMDLDDAARYYIVEEIIGHYEAYHGSTYLFRDRGEGQKWRFSPLWDCGHAFGASPNQHFYDVPEPTAYGNTWITDMVRNDRFMAKVRDTWRWFMQNCYGDLFREMSEYVEEVKSAAISDAERWNNEPQPNRPDGGETRPVADNSDIDSDLNRVTTYLSNRINWLKEIWGDYNSGIFAEPERDDTEAAPLPDYAKPTTPDISDIEPSGTLPVIHIDIHKTDAGGAELAELDFDVLSKDLADKNYRPGSYYITVPEGSDFAAVGTPEEPLPLEMKARGNFTRVGFAKKPFKLKLGVKQNLLGLTDRGSKHWAILTHADDDRGYLRNFVGFNIGEMIGLPWTPGMQPVEVVINGDYRGIYFLTESIRIEKGRLDIDEAVDNETDPAMISGGYLVELDNYKDDPATIIINENPARGHDTVYVTPDTPEEYSPLQKQFITDQFVTMHNMVKNGRDNLWSYIDIDDAARYYIVEEIIGHYEAYHGSTYLYREKGHGNKWHFSPLWDCGHAFDAGERQHFYETPGTYGNTWITDIVRNDRFMQKVRDTWSWFRATGFLDDLNSMIDAYANSVETAAALDSKRWKDAPLPEKITLSDPQPVADNTDVIAKSRSVKEYLSRRAEWLNSIWTSDSSDSEPETDNILAAHLPDYARAGYDATDTEYTLYFNNSGNWAGGAPKVWAWNDSNDYLAAGDWNDRPEMKKADHAAGEIWAYSFSEAPTSFIITKNGSDDKLKEDEIKYAANVVYGVNGEAHNLYHIWLVDKSDDPWSDIRVLVDDNGYRPLGDGAVMSHTSHAFGTDFNNDELEAGPARAATSSALDCEHILFYAEKPLTSDAKITFTNGNDDAENLSADFGSDGVFVRTADGDITTSVKDLFTEPMPDAEEYFDLSGRRISSPKPGSFVIVRRGDRYTKEIVR